MIIRARVLGGWGHFSADDWAGAFSECGCASSLTPCLPETVPVTARFYRSVASITSAYVSFSATASATTRAWASLASADAKPEEKP